MTAALASPAFAHPAPSRGTASARAWPERPVVEGPDLEAHLARAGADEETRAFARRLAEDGFAIIDLGDEGRALCDRIVAEVDPMFADPGVYRIQDLWLRSEAVRSLAALPAIVDRLSLVFGRPAFPFQTLNFHRGSQQGLHSDAIHFHSDPPGFMAGVWIALEDIAPDAGPLTYVPGSHRMPMMTMRDAGVDKARPTAADYERAYEPALSERLKASGLPVATATPRKGQAIVWLCNLAHGGSPIANPAATRRSLVAHFYFADCVYYTPVYSDVEGGRLEVRLPMNVKTGGFVWPRRNGRPVAPKFTAFLGACRKLLLRQPIITRQPRAA